MPSLWASPADRQRLANAESTLFLIGSYDGSGNYGDVLQLATAIETVNRLSRRPLPLVVVERETRAHHNELMRRYAESFPRAAFVFFSDSDGPMEGLVNLRTLQDRPTRAALYIYGGGYLNSWWGARKAAHASAAQQLAGARVLPVVASGLQVDQTAIASDGPAHELLARASWIGVRDADSLRYVRHQVPVAADRTELAGDDALPLLDHKSTESRPIVNLHVNDGSWISDDPSAIHESVAALLRELGGAAEEPLQLQPVIAYEDPRVSERAVIAGILERESDQLAGAGLRPIEPLDVLDDAIRNDLSKFRRARLTVSCSYHVTLTSLLAGIPAVMLAQNDYYEQKAAGLRDLFQLGPGRVGVPGTPEDASAAVEALVDGPTRTELVSHLRTQSRHVAERFERGRAALSVALAESLELSGLESELGTMRQRAEGAERELAAIHATRGWRFLNVLRAARDTMRKNHGASRSLMSRLPSWLPIQKKSAEPPPAPPPIPAELRDEMERLGDLVAEAKGRGDYALEVAQDVSLPTKMLAFMSWLELLPMRTGPLISVILATRDRPQLLARAIPSVIAQRYEHWQLVVVDNGEDPRTREVVEAIDDARLTFVVGPARGLGAARNAGLDHANGEIVCYLDDDNVMHSGWLQAVAHVFSKREDVDVAYGISIAEHRIPGDLGEHGWWPSLWQLPWSREMLLKDNVTDIGSLAHRRVLEEARFDVNVSSAEDWELLLRLTADREALAVPALSHAYTMDAPDRKSRDPDYLSGLDEIRRQHEGT